MYGIQYLILRLDNIITKFRRLNVESLDPAKNSLLNPCYTIFVKFLLDITVQMYLSMTYHYQLKDFDTDLILHTDSIFLIKHSIVMFNQINNL